MITESDIARKDAERAELEALMAQWQAAGGIPTLAVGCRQEKTMMNMRQLNACTWESKK